MQSETKKRHARTKKRALTHIRENAKMKLSHNTHTAFSKYNQMLLYG